MLEEKMNIQYYIIIFLLDKKNIFCKNKYNKLNKIISLKI